MTGDAYWKPIQVPLVHLSFSTGQLAAASNHWTTNSPQRITFTDAWVQCTTVAVIAGREGRDRER